MLDRYRIPEVPLHSVGEPMVKPWAWDGTDARSLPRWQKASVRERVDVLIDLLWQIYSRPEYLAIWDIAFGTRGDPALRAKLKYGLID